VDPHCTDWVHDHGVPIDLEGLRSHEDDYVLKLKSLLSDFEYSMNLILVLESVCRVGPYRKPLGVQV